MFAKRVFTPGPTQVPAEVLKAVTGHITYHRSAEFREFHSSLITKLKSLFQTTQNLNLLTVSGTGSMECAVTNFVAPGEKVLYINQGRFGLRWGSICKAYGIEADELLIVPGSAASVSDLQKLDLQKYSAVFLTHIETSTGTRTNVDELTSYIKSSCDALVIVDSITSVGATEFRFDSWKLDVAVSASQKGLMSPPGMAIIAYGARAFEKMNSNPRPRFYMDLRKEYTEQKGGFNAWTPSVGVLYGMDKSCDIIMLYGLEHWWEKTNKCAEYSRKKGVEIGFRLLSNSPCDSLTAFVMPESIPSGKLITAMKTKYGVQMANGQAELKDKIFRVSHMGDLFMEDFEMLFSAIEEEMEILSQSQ